MTAEDLTATVIDALSRIAPEIDPRSIDASTAIRDDLDLDSMDFLNFVLALHHRLGVDIPEPDYAKLSTVGAVVRYLESKLGPDGREPRHGADAAT